VVKTVDPSQGRVGDVLEFTITVGNKGSVSAENVIVTDTFPPYLDILEYSTSRGTLTMEGHTLTASIGSVAPSDLVIIRVRTSINTLAQPSTGYNTATVSSNSDSDLTNNTSTVTFIILPDTVKLVAPPAVVPPALPKTGAPEEQSSSPLLLLALGLLTITIGLVIRRRVAL
jgi:uncharacterized repeat protein (TIGR01451 family)